MKHDEVVGYFGGTFSGILTALQTNETLQIIQAVLSIISVVITTAYVIYKWYKKASKDGKITEEEIDELADKLLNKKEKK